MAARGVHAAGKLVATVASTPDERIFFAIPDDDTYHIVVELAGTFVATAQVLADVGSGLAAINTTEIASTGATQAATQTAAGVYAGIAGANAVAGCVQLTAYTSGAVEVNVWLLPGA